MTTRTPAAPRLVRGALGLLAGAALLATLPTSASAATPRVVGGAGATTPSWMTQVWISGLGGNGFCGGELVSSRWILTAAHCVRNEIGGAQVAPSAVRVRIGDPTLAAPTDANPGVGIDQIRINPANRPSSTFGDVAMLHLPAPVTNAPVALGDAGTDPVGAVPQVLGWGKTASGNLSPALQKVDQAIVDPSRCGIYGSDFTSESMLCAGGVRGQDSCNGDSGGPLALQPETATAVLLGTVDYGSDNCGDGSAAVYQRVTSGSTAAWVRTVVVRPTIAVQPAQPVIGDDVTLTVGGAWSDATYAWDLDGDGAYDDATGQTIKAPASPARTVSVLATSASAGDSAVARLALNPIDPTLTVSAPATAKEGDIVTLTLTSKGGAGTVTVRSTGTTVASKAVAVPAGGTATVDLQLANDSRWAAPRNVAFSVTADGTLRPNPASVSVKVTDDDAPRLSSVSARSTISGSTVKAKVPGKGRVTAVATIAGRTVARGTKTTNKAGTVSVRLRLTRAQRARRPQIRLTWTSSDASRVTATASRRLG